LFKFFYTTTKSFYNNYSNCWLIFISPLKALYLVRFLFAKLDLVILMQFGFCVIPPCRGVARQKILGGPLLKYVRVHAHCTKHTQHVKYALLLGCSGLWGMHPQEIFENKCFEIESGSNFSK